MIMKRSIMSITILAVSVGAGGAVGLGAGVAFAYGPTLFSPAGLLAGPRVSTKPIPEPVYQVNADGLSYGSAADATSPATEPDLIRVEASNGLVGYVIKTELDAANGTTAAESFKSPEDAIRWQEAEGRIDHTVTVYDVDGKSAIGEFVVVGYDTQQAINEKDRDN